MVVLLLGLTSCATLFTGTKDTISFSSTPEGAKVIMDGMELCTTPCHADVKRSLKDRTVEFALDGYKTKIVELDKEFNLISILNLGGMLGWVVDLATGSIFKYDKKNYEVSLEKQDKVATIAKSNKYKTYSVELNTVTKEATIYVMK